MGAVGGQGTGGGRTRWQQSMFCDRRQQKKGQGGLLRVHRARKGVVPAVSVTGEAEAVAGRGCWPRLLTVREWLAH